MAYDNPIPGYATPTTSNLRLWDALPIDEFDLQVGGRGLLSLPLSLPHQFTIASSSLPKMQAFNAGEYDRVSRR